MAAMAFAVKGARNGLLLEALKGCLQSLHFCAAFRRLRTNAPYYRLSPETWRYILDCEPQRRESVAAKLRRQFGRLPHQPLVPG